MLACKDWYINEQGQVQIPTGLGGLRKEPASDSVARAAQCRFGCGRVGALLVHTAR